MELFSITNPVESRISKKASDARRPIGGTLELLPLCNMDCKMCYVRQSVQQMNAQGRMLGCDEWLRIAREMYDEGVLFLLLTGGEPFLYPEFERLYTTLTDMGFVITINTNGTLITEKWVKVMSERPCRRLNITLYGKDDDTYAQLCGNPKGFSQLMHNLHLLKENDIPFKLNCSATPYNAHQIHDLYAIARELGVELSTASYMFPPSRKNGQGIEHYERMTPALAAKTQMEVNIAKNPGIPLKTIAKNILNRVGAKADFSTLEGPNCRAGRCGFWVTWKGDLYACGMLGEPKMSLLDHPFKEAWEYITEEVKKIKRCTKCESCNLMGICSTCTAACFTETGKTDAVPDYLCHQAEELEKLCKNILNDKE